MERHTRSPQPQQEKPGRERETRPRPHLGADAYLPAGKLRGKRALVTGGDSGIGRSVSVLYALEGADVAVIYLEEDEDAKETRRLVQDAGGRCVLIRGDIGSRQFCDDAVAQAVAELGGLDILVNNAGEHFLTDSFEDISDEQIERTFRTNIFAQFYLTRAALPHLQSGSSIICTTSITAYHGHHKLIDYAATKGAVVAFVRSLSQALIDRGIRVNGVAPGPIWTPLIVATYPGEKVDGFGANAPMGRPCQPDEVSACYVFLASRDSAYMTGQVLHPPGGYVVNG